jgi:hypothetical protein
MTIASKRAASLGSLMLLCAVGLVGCGGSGGDPNRNSVQGTVTFDGVPVDGGVIMFLPADAESVKAGGEIIAGKYNLEAAKGPNPGEHRVQILWDKKTGRQIPSNDPPNTIDETKQVIPPQYNADSKLRADIKPGRNTHDFALTSK